MSNNNQDNDYTFGDDMGFPASGDIFGSENSNPMQGQSMGSSQSMQSRPQVNMQQGRPISNPQVQQQRPQGNTSQGVSRPNLQQVQQQRPQGNMQQGRPRPRPNPQEQQQRPSSSAGLPNPNEPVRNPRQQAQQQQMKPQQSVNPAEVSNVATSEVSQTTNTTVKSKKKKKLWIIPIIIVALGGTLFGIRQYNLSRNGASNDDVYQVITNYEDTGRCALDNYLNLITDYNSDALRGYLPTSWVAQEWEYANSDSLRENWIRSICSYVRFTYPQSQAVNNLGDLMVSEDGSPIMQDSDLLNNELVGVTVVDYDVLSAKMAEDMPMILDAYKKSGYSPSDYDYQNEMTNLMLDYLLEKANFPTKTVNMSFTFEECANIPDSDDSSSDSSYADSSYADSSYSDEFDTSNTESSSYEDTILTESSNYSDILLGMKYRLADDSELDKLLFSSEEFHKLLDTYGTIIANYEALHEDERIAEEKAEHDKLVASYKSKLEKMQAEAIANGVSEEEAKKIKLPDEEMILEWVEPERKFANGYTPELVIPYTWCGAYYAQNEYKGTSNKDAQVGDGSFELPAGIGTTVITKALCEDGKFHDVKVTLESYYIGKNAIDYAISFSEKNRGFDPTAPVKLICYEIRVENLEDEPITVIADMFLSDEHSNQSAKTGTMYGFYSKATIPAGGADIINDWATSTELDQKYVCWGKSFQRQYPVVWFKLLAGSGEEVPTYNANESYINRSNIDQFGEMDSSVGVTTGVSEVSGQGTEQTETETITSVTEETEPQITETESQLTETEPQITESQDTSDSSITDDNDTGEGLDGLF